MKNPKLAEQIEKIRKDYAETGFTKDAALMLAHNTACECMCRLINRCFENDYLAPTTHVQGAIHRLMVEGILSGMMHISGAAAADVKIDDAILSINQNDINRLIKELMDSIGAKAFEIRPGKGEFGE
jgi:hypothetical protein